MSYCNHSDISIALQLPAYDTESQPTATQITDIIAMIDGMIDSALSSIGVTLPVSNALFLQVLKSASINGTAGRVSGSYKKNQFGTVETNFYWNEFKLFLADITDNPDKYLKMSDSGSSLAGVAPSNNVTAGYVSESDLSFREDVRFP